MIMITISWLPTAFLETSWRLASPLVRLYHLRFQPSKSDLKQKQYGQNENIIASHGNSGRQAGGLLGSCLDCVNLVNQRPTFLFTPSKSDLTWLRYCQNTNFIANHGISESCWRLAMQLVVRIPDPLNSRPGKSSEREIIVKLRLRARDSQIF